MENKKRFRLFDMNRDGKGVDEQEDTTPTLKYFFKLLWRKFPQLLSLNVLMVVPVLFLVAAILIYLNSETAPAMTSPSFAALYGANLAAPTTPGANILALILPVSRVVAYHAAGVYWAIGFCVIAVLLFGLCNVGSSYVLRGMVRHDPVFVFSDFFHGVKRNAKQGFLFGLLDAFLIFLLAYDWLFFNANTGSFFSNVAYFLSFALIILFTMMHFYLYLMMVTFDLGNFKLLKNAFIFSILGIKRNIMALLGIVLLTAVFVMLIILLLPYGIAIPLLLPFFFYLPLVGFISHYAAYPVLDRYMIQPYLEKQKQAEPAAE